MINLWFIDSNIVWWFIRQVDLMETEMKASSKIALWKDMDDSSTLQESSCSKELFQKGSYLKDLKSYFFFILRISVD